MHLTLLCRARAFLLGAFFVFSLNCTWGQEPSGDYRLSPGDILIIQVVNEKDLMSECRVTSSGTITYQWLSNVEVGGKTQAEVEQVLRKKLDEDYLVNPTVLVQVKSYREKEITVMGFVNRPGAVIIPAEQNLTLVDAIGKAGGIARGGDPRNILFQRRGQLERKQYKLEDLQKITDPEKIVYVQPGDVIEVREKAF